MQDGWKTDLVEGAMVAQKAGGWTDYDWVKNSRELSGMDLVAAVEVVSPPSQGYRA